MKAARTIVALLIALLVCPATAPAHRRDGCEWFAPNVWHNPYRKAILQSAGAIKVNADGTYKFLITPLKVFPKPVRILFSFDSQSGLLTGLSVYQTSGDRAIDQRALLIVRNAAPFHYDKTYGTQKEAHVVDFGERDVIVTNLARYEQEHQK